jgi:hypothetical protein
VYGVLDVFNALGTDPESAHGKSFFVLRGGARKLATLTSGAGWQDNGGIGTLSHCAHVLLDILTRRKKVAMPGALAGECAADSGGGGGSAGGDGGDGDGGGDGERASHTNPLLASAADGDPNQMARWREEDLMTEYGPRVRGLLAAFDSAATTWSDAIATLKVRTTLHNDANEAFAGDGNDNGDGNGNGDDDGGEGRSNPRVDPTTAPSASWAHPCAAFKKLVGAAASGSGDGGSGSGRPKSLSGETGRGMRAAHAAGLLPSQVELQLHGAINPDDVAALYVHPDDDTAATKKWLDMIEFQHPEIRLQRPDPDPDVTALSVGPIWFG